MLIVLLITNLLYCNSSLSQDSYALQLSKAAIELTKDTITYDPSYYSLQYPGGDVPKGRGVCTDVVVRAYRKLGTDLQVKVHEDMKANFGIYPKRWALKRTDRNIDHRRVPNLATFFGRHGEKLPNSQYAKDYKAGDIVCWDLGKGVPHIGIITHKIALNGQHPLIVHNVGAGQVLEDCLFSYKITGHYRYRPIND